MDNFVSLAVSQAFIHGSPEMYIRSGSDISLACTAKDMPEPPTHFTWYKGLQIFSGGGSTETTRTSFFGISKSSASGAKKVSIETSPNGLENLLLIRSAVAADSGNYTCIPAGAEPASIVVHVLNGMTFTTEISKLALGDVLIS